MAKVKKGDLSASSVQRMDCMNRNPGLRTFVTAALWVVSAGFPTTPLRGQVVSLDPAKMPPIDTVDERFQSYNIEMVEVIGGNFWKPYGSATNNRKAEKAAPPEGFHSGRHRPAPLSIPGAH